MHTYIHTHMDLSIPSSVREDKLCVLDPILYRNVLHLPVVNQSEATIRQQQDIAGVGVAVELT